MLLQQLAEADRARETCRTGADDEEADVDRSSGGADGAVIASAGSNGGGNSEALRAVAPRLDELGEARQHLLHVADDAEVGELEDRGVPVLVDRDDRSGALHPDLVLDRPGDPDGDVELRRNRLPGLPDLRGVRVPACVDHRAGRGDGAAERLGEALAELEALRAPRPAAAGDDDVRLLELRALVRRVRLLDHAHRLRVWGNLDGDLLHRRLAAAPRGLVAAGADKGDAWRPDPADVDEDGVLEGGARPDELVALRAQAGQIPVQPGLETYGEACGDVGREDRVREEDRVVAALLDEAREERDARLRKRGGEDVVLSHEHRLRAVSGGLGGERRDARRRRGARPPRPARPRRRGRRVRPAGACRRGARRRRGASYELPLHEEVHDRLGSVSVAVLDDARVAAARRLAERAHRRARARLAGLVGRETEVGQRELLLRLRLGGHDPLERGVAGLVDRVRDRDDRGKRGLERCRTRTRSGASPARCRRRS